MISARNISMKFPHFRSKNVEGLSKQDETVFAEASELALLRLEQCIADLQIWAPKRPDTPDPRTVRPFNRHGAH
jgi:hypothetical protein